MKKLTLFSIALIAISFASCKKDRTCTCKHSTTEPGAQVVEVKTVYHKVSKKTAKAACMNTSILPSGEIYSETTDCTLN